MRKWFPSEFTWRLYVVLQVAALVVSTVMVLAILMNENFFTYRPIYEEVEIDQAEAEAKCALLSDDPNDDQSAFAEYWPQSKVSPQQACFDRETRPRVVGKELVGISSETLGPVLFLFFLAFAVPIAVVRVPSWLLEGWRKDR